VTLQKMMRTIVTTSKIQMIQENYSDPSENSNHSGKLYLALQKNHENCIRPSRNPIYSNPLRKFRNLK
jgi:hypothetical protein